jgi:Flp pilus assembly protein TadD
VAAAVALALFALVGQLGNNAASGSARAAGKGDFRAAVRLARQARRWAPWSYEPWQLLGEAQLGLGDAKAARRSLREALERDRAEWRVWYDLALASRGAERKRALAQASRLDPFAVPRGSKE